MARKVDPDKRQREEKGCLTEEVSHAMCWHGETGVEMA